MVTTYDAASVQRSETFPSDMYKRDNPALDGRHSGVIVQEVKEVIPEMVTTTSETVDDEILDDFHLLDSGRLVPMLVQAVKELKAENDVLKALVCQDQPEAALCSD
ncbi:MAG: tail fiber domain-containing protein [Proteobacteria bacterium]|nr:tail fiber domain-containing protein [Pseudomonadota bacterium]